MPGENVEVDIEVAHVHVEMHSALRSIDKHGDSSLVRDFDDFLDWDHGPKDVGHLRYCDDLRSIAQLAFECVKRKGAVVAHIDPPQDGALAFAVEVPRHDVGVMLHHAQHNLITRANVRKSKAGGDEIDRLSRRSCENDLFVRSGVDEPSHGFSGRLIRLSRSVGEIVQAAMHIRILVLIGACQAINDLPRLLSGGSVVQIHKRLSIGTLGKDREIGPHRFDVVSVERRLE